jgi:hypothetical protein
LECGDVVGAIEALYEVWSAFDHICAIADFYTRNVCVQQAQPFPDIAWYEPTPPEKWMCSRRIRACFQRMGVVTENPPRVTPAIDYFRMRIEFHERAFMEVMDLMDRAKELHLRCMEEGRIECWNAYLALLRDISTLARVNRELVGILERPFQRRRRPPPVPPPGIGGTINLMNYYYFYCSRITRYRPIPPARLNRTLARTITFEALDPRPLEVKRVLYDIAFKIAKEWCRDPREPRRQLTAGICTTWTIPKINTRMRQLERRLREGRITDYRYEEFIKELEEKCKKLGGTWTGTRCIP